MEEVVEKLSVSLVKVPAFCNKPRQSSKLWGGHLELSIGTSKKKIEKV
jgi:hypothetical protein